MRSAVRGWGALRKPSLRTLCCTGLGRALGRVAALEEAKAQFQQSWDAWKAWAKLEEMP